MAAAGNTDCPRGLSGRKKERQVFVKPVRRPDRIAEYFRREWADLLIVAVSGTIFNMGQSLVAVRQGGLIDAIADAASRPGAAEGGAATGTLTSGHAAAAVSFLITVLIVQALRLVKRFYVRRFANISRISMRMMVYNHIIHEDISTLESENAGQVMTKALGDVDLTVEGMRKITTEIFDTGVLMGTYFITMLRYDIKCTLLSCLFIPAAMLCAEKLKGVISKYNRLARQQGGVVADRTLDMVKNSMLYRVTGSEERIAADYEQELSSLESLQVRAGYLENSMQPVYNAISLLGTILVIFFGGRLVIAGTWTVGDFSAFLTMFLALALKASKVSKLFNSCQKAKVSWKRVKPYLTPWQGESALSSPQGGQNAALPALEDASLSAVATIHADGWGRTRRVPENFLLNAAGLTMSWKNGKELFSPVSFAGKRGQIIGVTGPVACGKSSLGLALTGLYGYGGSVLLAGRELKMYTRQDCSRLISYAGHDTQLFDISIRDNITMGREADETRLMQVIRDVCLDEDFTAKGQAEGGRIDLPAGPDGRALSGGQRSRLAAARALYGHTPLIILDEPFANVDRHTERAMIAHLKEHYQDCLLIILSHRLMVFPQTDLVLAFEENGMVRVGKHEELLKSSRLYAENFELQRRAAQAQDLDAAQAQGLTPGMAQELDANRAQGLDAAQAQGLETGRAQEEFSAGKGTENPEQEARNE